MVDTLLYNTSLICPDTVLTDSSIVLSRGLIRMIEGTPSGAGESFDCAGLTLFPGFIDVHIHGAVGFDVNAADVDELSEIARFLATKGVTSWVPTLVPDSDENYARVISAINLLIEIQREKPIAQAVGVHYEGVFANEKMCGALRPEYFKSFRGDQLSELPKLKRGLHMTTFAPEIEGGIELAKELKRQGWVASIGHTRADVETLDKAFEAGATHLTHFYNAMTGIHHRNVGVAGWGLTNPEVTFDIIADGVHVDPRMLEFACRAKTPDRVTLISDAIAPTGLGDGDYEMWGEKIAVQNGRTQNERGSIAGSVVTMLDAVKGMLSIGFTAVEVSRMASYNPARLIGIADERGSIEVGKRADLVGIDADGEVRLTVIGGRVVYDNR